MEKFLIGLCVVAFLILVFGNGWMLGVGMGICFFILFLGSAWTAREIDFGDVALSLFFAVIFGALAYFGLEAIAESLKHAGHATNLTK